MARQVDPEDRRRDIAQAALQLLARVGPRGLTMRALAAELNGSLTLITHYYSSRADILTDLARQLSSAWRDELSTLEATEQDPQERLRTLLEWMLPMTPEGRVEERARFALMTDRDDPDCAQVLREFDAEMRSLLTTHLQLVLPDKEVETAVSLLRATTSGVVLEDYLDADAWPASRQLELVDELTAWVLSKAST